MSNSNQRPWYKDPRILFPAIVAILVALIVGFFALYAALPQTPTTPVFSETSGEIDTDGNYEISWKRSIRAKSYILQEDMDPSFTNPRTIDTNSGTRGQIYGKSNGDYYYRVRACNDAGESEWSSSRRVTVEISTINGSSQMLTPTTTPKPTQTQITLTPTLTPIPTMTTAPTPKPTATPKPTQTLTPTLTPTPIMTTTPTPTSVPNGGSDDCKYPPTVTFNKTKYYEEDTVHATVSTSHSSVDYKIKDCGGNIHKSGDISNGGTIYYTIPKGVSECCNWEICFYWGEGGSDIGPLDAGGELTAHSYECTKCYKFEVCPKTTCDVYVIIDDPYCVGYMAYVDDVYQLTEGEHGTPDGYCAFYVTEGTHTIEIRKNGCFASKTYDFLCGVNYSWVSMPDDLCNLCVLVATPTPTKTATPTPPVTVKITEPEDGGDFPLGRSTIVGTLSNVPEDPHLWIVLSKSNGRYYPFDKPYIRGDTWEVTSYGVGKDNMAKEDGDTFVIGAYLSNDAANKEFVQYAEEIEAENWGGLDSLPEGATKYDEVSVIGRR